MVKRLGFFIHDKVEDVHLLVPFWEDIFLHRGWDCLPFTWACWQLVSLLFVTIPAVTPNAVATGVMGPLAFHCGVQPQGQLWRPCLHLQGWGSAHRSHTFP